MVTGRLHARLGSHVYDLRLGELFAADTGFLIERDPDTVRAPDCAFVSAERLPDPSPDDYLPFAPDLAVETVSPSDRGPSVREKVGMWLAAGARLVWVVSPEKRMITVYRPGSEPHVLRVGDVLDGEDVMPGFRLELEELFR